MEQLPTRSESDQTAALRAELEQELRNKKRCSYSSYECTQLSLDGYKYCPRHILQDKNAPFKQCTYIYGTNGKRCHLPAPKSDKKEYGYCSEHALKATLARNKQNSKYPPPSTAEVLLNSLTHYIKKPRTRSVSSSTHQSDEERGTSDDILGKVTRSNDPFVDIDANSIFSDHCSDVLDFCSESESDIEPSTFSSVWHDYQADSSDNESIDSDQEDPLKHANVYTAEEITSITRDKLVRLQSLYIEQYRHLQYLLREKKRKYLHSLKREKETCCNIYNQVRDNPKEQRLYRKLKALNNYHKHHGVDGILNRRLRDLRSKLVDGSSQKPNSFTKCAFTEGGVKCGEQVLPLAKHCRKHILEDPNQVLFKHCGKMTGDVECTTPVAAIFDEATCPLHMEIPPLTSYNQLRKDSESDFEDSAEANLQQYSAHFSDNVKHEFMDYIPPEIPKMETVPSLLFEENSQGMDLLASQNAAFTDTSEINLELKSEAEEQLMPEKAEEFCQNVAGLTGNPQAGQSEDAEIRTGDSQKPVVEETSGTILNESVAEGTASLSDRRNEEVVVSDLPNEPSDQLAVNHSDVPQMQELPDNKVQGVQHEQIVQGEELNVSVDDKSLIDVMENQSGTEDIKVERSEEEEICKMEIDEGDLKIENQSNIEEGIELKSEGKDGT